MIDLKKPMKLSGERAWRTYIGGSLIDGLHGRKEALDTNFPEEWIMSTVRARNTGREDIVEGLSMVAGEPDISLADVIEKYPVEMLGETHMKQCGKTLGVLVKIIDSAERLTVQVHPTKEKARMLFDSAYGKTECWHILGGREINGEKPCIYLGFKEGITREYWKHLFDTQNIEKMLDCLHKFEVKAGDTFLVEGGIPHAIGAGCLLVEVQEPTDYTSRVERTTPSGLAVSDFMCHQGIGFEKMFDCFTYQGFTEQEVLDKWYIKQEERKIIGYDSTELFKLAMVNIQSEEVFESGGVFSGIYILEGNGYLNDEIIKPGEQFFISAMCEKFEIKGNLRFIRFWGPRGRN